MPLDCNLTGNLVVDTYLDVPSGLDMFQSGLTLDPLYVQGKNIVLPSPVVMFLGSIVYKIPVKENATSLVFLFLVLQWSYDCLKTKFFGEACPGRGGGGGGVGEGGGVGHKISHPHPFEGSVRPHPPFFLY